MAGVTGITEPYWSTLHEDKKFYWRSFIRVVAFGAGFLIARTGYLYLDLCVGGLTAVFSILAIESQRTYKEHTAKLRKTLVRICIFLGSWSLAILGIAIFVQIGIVTAGIAVAQMIVPQIRSSGSVITNILLIATAVFASYSAILRSFREMGVEDLIYHLPKSRLKRLLIERPFIAQNFLFFAYFELSILLVTFLYSSMVSEVVKLFVSLTVLVR